MHENTFDSQLTPRDRVARLLDRGTRRHEDGTQDRARAAKNTPFSPNRIAVVFGRLPMALPINRPRNRRQARAVPIRPF
jgi:hypothetical protein